MLDSAPNTMPDQPPDGVTAGIDWAKDDHVIAVVDAAGTVMDRFTVDRTGASLERVLQRLARAGAVEATIERPDGPVIDALITAGITVVVISPNQVKHLRSRYGSAGNKDDRFDAFVLADTLRTDAANFTSPPRSGQVRAARLLSEIGDCRERFPTPNSLACLAGVAPATRQSGKSHVVSFRWAADKQLRDAVTEFAGDSRRANPWAAVLDHRARARGHDHPHAVRILARAWLFVIWH